MQIAINCRSFLNKSYTGIGRYTYNLVDQLLKIDQKNTYQLYCAMRFFDRKKKLPQFTSSRAFIKRDAFKRGIQSTLKNVDIYHSPSPDVFSLAKAKSIVTIHDLVYKAFPEGHTQQTLELTDAQMKSFLPTVSHLICVSKNTKVDLMKYFSVEEKKISVVYQGVDKKMFRRFDQEELKVAKAQLQREGIEGPFILFIGTIEPRKNLKNICRAFSYLKQKGGFTAKLVIVGMKGWMSEDFENFLAELKISNDVYLPGFLSNEELCAYYNCASLFIFPSFYEGFGYPILEAFCCGAPLITSNRSSCQEIAADAAYTVDPTDVEGIAEGIQKILNEPQFQEGLRQKGFERVESFGFERTARETLKIYEKVYQGEL